MSKTENLAACLLETLSWSRSRVEGCMLWPAWPSERTGLVRLPGDMSTPPCPPRALGKALGRKACAPFRRRLAKQDAESQVNGLGKTPLCRLPAGLPQWRIQRQPGRGGEGRSSFCLLTGVWTFTYLSGSYNPPPPFPSGSELDFTSSTRPCASFGPFISHVHCIHATVADRGTPVSPCPRATATRIDTDIPDSSSSHRPLSPNHETKNTP